ncbi:hypothetical protein DFP72DRAFT_184164 [Ephemerocybe angulata]|uniref:Uncharacterized protein n=1 Tax=Ephemerocybe angulata TaxID=980116 RepID=A0A8H6H8I7_9AGAR|nr:hypothetical protein DFP72DRAFT_184164 [Tulosesus angulatus]
MPSHIPPCRRSRSTNPHPASTPNPTSHGPTPSPSPSPPDFPPLSPPYLPACHVFTKPSPTTASTITAPHRKKNKGHARRVRSRWEAKAGSTREAERRGQCALLGGTGGSGARPEASTYADGGDGEASAGEEGGSTTMKTTPRRKRRESGTPRPLSDTNSLSHPVPDATPLSPSVIVELSQSAPPTPRPNSKRSQRARRRQITNRRNCPRPPPRIPTTNSSANVSTSRDGPNVAGAWRGPQLSDVCDQRALVRRVEAEVGGQSGTRTASRRGSGSRARSSSLCQIPRPV